MDKEYYNYLLKITPMGRWYRESVVYPLINKWALGLTLDVGCGIGLYLASKDSTCGVDINLECVEHCKGLYGDRVKAMCEDSIPYEKEVFDSVVLDNVLEHVASPVPLLEDCLRVLKPGGRIIILVPGLKGYRKDPDHKIFYDFDKLSLLGRKINCRTIHMRSLPFTGLSRLSSLFCYFVVYEA
jgi:SAM-dependent methyltransferase